MAALEQLTLAPGPQPPSSPPAVADEGPKVPRLPRWTRQEILVLIQGKRVAENRVRRGRTAGLPFGSGQVEPKWASVSSYCKRHGVNRGPVQCRKRWSNLAGDYKKIKEWESQIRDETDSFWLMRNDLRREKKLPGFFDKEVYDILDGGGPTAAEELDLALAPSTMAAAPEEADTDAVFDSGRTAGPDDGLFSDFEQSVQEDVGDREFRQAKETPVTTVQDPVPISEKQYQPFSESHQAQDAGTSFEKQCNLNPENEEEKEIGGEGKKRKRHAAEVEEEEEDETELAVQDRLIKVLERNGKLVSSQLESQNNNLELDREQRKDHVNNLISVLHKLADAMGRIADKL